MASEDALGYDLRLVDVEVEELRAEADRLSRLEGNVCIRALARKSDVFCALAECTAITSLVSPEMAPVKMTLFDKTAKANWPVSWHQDRFIAVKNRVQLPGFGGWSEKEGVIHVQPPTELLESMVAVRLHLDPCPEENGALRVLPRSHRLGVLPSEGVRKLPKDDEVVVECEPAEVLLMKPLLVHSSSRSTHPGHRRVVHIEFAKRRALPDPLAWAF